MTSIRAVLGPFARSLICDVVVCLVLGLSTAKLGAQVMTGITTGGKVAKFPVDDIITRPDIEYPYEARRSDHQGRGLYRVTLDPKTGWVRNVVVIKSTGWTSLDNAALRGLRQLHLKPGKWKQVEFPFLFTLSRSREEATERVRRLRAEGVIK